MQPSTPPGTPAPGHRARRRLGRRSGPGRAAAEVVEAAFIDDLDKLLARDDIDAVTVTTATSAHRPIMLGAAQAGKHIFTEKLLAPTVAEAEEIIDTADKAGIALVVSLYLYRGYTRAILGSSMRRLGELTLLPDPAVSTMGRSPAGCRNASMTPRRPSAVRSAISDAIRSTSRSFSSVRPATVSATYASFTKRQVEDQAVVTLRYPGGAIGVVETGFLSRDPFTIEMHGTAPAWRTTARTTCSGCVAPEKTPGSRSRCLKTMLTVRAGGCRIRDRTRADDNLARAVELTRLVSTANTAAATGTTVHYPVGAA